MSREIRGRGRAGKSGKQKGQGTRSVPYQEGEGEQGLEERPGTSTPHPQGGETKGRSTGLSSESGRDRGDGKGAGRSHPQKSEGKGKPREEEMGQGEGSRLGRGRVGSGDKREETVQPEAKGGMQSPSEGVQPASEKGLQISGEGGDVGSMGGGGDAASTSYKPAGERKKKYMEEFIVSRPKTCATKKGTTGSQVSLKSNYFDIKPIPNWILNQYQVSFDVDEDRDIVRKAWLNKHRNEAIKSAFIFDGSNLYTTKRLTNKKPDILNLETISREGKVVHIEVKFVQELRRGHAAYLQVFNVLLRAALASLNLHLVQRNYFDPNASVRLPQHYLEIWPGYATHLREHDGGIMMCTKVSHKIMRTDTAFHILKECTNSPDYKRSFQQAIIGSVVLTDYTNKTYQVADVDFNKNPMSQFSYKGKQITFVDYYKERYGIVIKDVKQPLLTTRKIDKAPKNASESQKSTREVLLVPELCRMTGLSNKMINNRTLMRDMSVITRVSPSQRMDRLLTFNNRLHSCEQVLKDFGSWGLEISRKLRTVKGRVLPAETIRVGNNRTFPVGPEYDWTVPLRSSPMFTQSALRKWVFISPIKMKDAVDSFLPVLRKAAEGMHIRIPPPIFLFTKTENIAEVMEAVEKALANQSPDMLGFGFTNDRPDRYAAVKRKCCVDRGVISQVILLRSMTSKGVLSIATKIAIQIHTKIGGVPWNVPIPAEKCMVVGFDVCHDSMSKSVGAMVASTSPNMSTWFSSVNQHSSKEEISFYLANDIYRALLKYADKNNVLPTRIVVYRDGVGEGQIGHVIEHEVNALKEKLNELYKGPSWKMAFVVVTKRINTRLFLEPHKANPFPGTIVDDEITQPERYDFFLVSQSVRQGTVTPTLYNIISDNVGWSPDILQRFTFKLTHLYYNSSTPVQVPAPCQYAHKLAFLTNQSLHGVHHEKLNETLFFL